MKFFCFLVCLLAVTQIWTFPKLVSSSLSPCPSSVFSYACSVVGMGCFFWPAMMSHTLIRVRFLFDARDGAWCGAECGQGAARDCHCKVNRPHSEWVSEQVQRHGLASAFTTVSDFLIMHNKHLFCVSSFVVLLLLMSKDRRCDWHRHWKPRLNRFWGPT